jgi:hypothetical protein
MSNIVPLRGSRDVARALSRLDDDTMVELAGLHSRRMVEVAKTQVIGSVSRSALEQACLLAVKEVQCAGEAPHAIPDYARIRSAGTRALASSIDDLSERLQRLR